MNNQIQEQLERLGLSIEEVDEPQVSNSAEAKKEAEDILYVIRAWLGQTYFRNLYAAWQRGDRSYKAVIDIARQAKEISHPHLLAKYTTYFVKNMCGGENGPAKAQKALDAYERLQNRGASWECSTWGLIRAMSTAIRHTNFGHQVKNTGFIYTGDSDHRITTVMQTGEYRWTEPTKFTLGLMPAIEPDDYTSPFAVQYITNPENPDEQIQIRVYKRMGTAVHPSSSYSQYELDMNDPLVKKVMTLKSGEVAVKTYDSELHVSEFERQAERDVDFILDKADEWGAKFWHKIDSDRKQVTIYRADMAQMH